MRKLPDTERKRIRAQRACLRGYSWGFPGGESAFLKADSDALRIDLDHLTDLFDRYQQAVTLPAATFPLKEGPFSRAALLESAKVPLFKRLANGDPCDERRVEEMSEGWDKTQVLLWGNWFYIRTLNHEEQYAKALQEIDRVRSSFGLELVPLHTWDKAEDATYFSPQTLRNMILILEYRAKAAVYAHDQLSVTNNAKDFLLHRYELSPHFEMTGGDPTRFILKPACDAQ